MAGSPATEDYNAAGNTDSSRRTVELAGWPTPTRTLADKGVRSEAGAVVEASRSHGPDLAASASLASWATPTAQGGTGYMSGTNRDTWRPTLEGQARGLFPVLHQGRPTTLASWATPAAREAGGTPEQFLARKAKAKAKGAQLGESLTSLSLQATLAGWATPTSRDHKDGASDGTAPVNGLLGCQCWEASGATPSGSTAATGSGGRLNPVFTLWLMGFPTEWVSCGALVTPSSRSKRRRS